MSYTHGQTLCNARILVKAKGEHAVQVCELDGANQIRVVEQNKSDPDACTLHSVYSIHISW